MKTNLNKNKEISNNNNDKDKSNFCCKKNFTLANTGDLSIFISSKQVQISLRMV